MKRVWKRISALLVVCAVLAALAPAALADGGADTYRIAVSAVPAVVTAGGSATVSATVYSRSETDGKWSEYLGGGAVILSLTHLRAHETREDLVCRLLERG